MQHLTASLRAASVALIGCATIAATPVAVPPPHTTDVSSPAVKLTAGIDPFAAWANVFNTATGNATIMWNTFSAAPFVSDQQALVNLLHGEFVSPLTVLGAIAQPSTDISLSPSPLSLSNDAFHTIFTLVLPQFLPSNLPISESTLETLLSFAASSISGDIMGSLGPAISPIVALGNSISDVVTALSGPSPDVTTALQDFIDIPANLVGGLLNGATLNLDALIPLLASTLPQGMGIDSLSYSFGGLLSPGYTINNVAGFVAEVTDGSSPGIGGSIINGLGIHLSGALPLPIDGVPVGPIGAWLGTQEIIANAMGWDGTGNPLADLFGTAEASSASLFSDLGNLLGL